MLCSRSFDVGAISMIWVCWDLSFSCCGWLYDMGFLVCKAVVDRMIKIVWIR